MLDKRPSERPERICEIEVYENIPYLNGRLFRPIDSLERGIDDTDFDVQDSVLGSIVNLLERYNFSAEGGPTDLDPSILGNVFEKTINHITGDTGDQKKELGAFYTPDEITRIWLWTFSFVYIGLSLSTRSTPYTLYAALPSRLIAGALARYNSL